MGCWEAIVPREGGIPRVGLWKIRPAECPGEPGCAHLSLQHSRALGGGHGPAWAGSAPERRGTAGKSLYSSSSILQQHPPAPCGAAPQPSLGRASPGTHLCAEGLNPPQDSPLCAGGAHSSPRVSRRRLLSSHLAVVGSWLGRETSAQGAQAKRLKVY